VKQHWTYVLLRLLFFRLILKVHNQVLESSIVEGTTVYAGGSSDLGGIANWDLPVNPLCHLSVTGGFNAAVKNYGGLVEIEGVVDHIFF
jgi:hypothetical protein